MKFTSLAALVALVSANEGADVEQAIRDEDIAKETKKFQKFLDGKKVEDHRFNSKEYLASDGVTKKGQLWEQITADESSGSFPNALELPGIFIEAMDPTFKTAGDQMPSELFGLTTRTKYIHSVGVVGKVKFVSSNEHPFTGVWQGAENGLVRLSSAAEPSSS